MTRIRIALPAVCLGGLALVMTTPLSAAAADRSWDGDTNVAWDVAANWSDGVVPSAGDALFFPVVGVHGYADNNLANPFVADRLEVTGENVSLAGWPIVIDPAGSTGIRIAAGGVTITPELRLQGDQTLLVEAGASVDFPSNIRVESGTTTAQVDGEAFINALDGVGFAGGFVKEGAGVLWLRGAGGVGGGVQVDEGTVFTDGDGAGADWIVRDGAKLTGGAATIGLAQALLTLAVLDGTLSPGDELDGSGYANFMVWNGLDMGSDSILQLDVSTTGWDQVQTLEGTAIAGARLDIRMGTPPAVGDGWRIVAQEREGEFVASFTTASGAAIVPGEVFESNGYLYSIEVSDEGRYVDLYYEGVAPPAPPPPAPLPATGPERAVPLAALVLLLVTVGATLVGIRRRTA